ncbi:hypothetical protein MF406_02900 [Georgenia sp. TF02-10]|uniref:septum site-determining protein Ssd n=1 Tax=Georgenia sp. TF02-10 TaxID=2917725 RepID=UPI001FA7F8DC|nr:septum site-determining protein Ssd [Georgenia sp. TF02-10]UNX55245.1 hypothetical protein MF406_02900 [Georgenia sp. TF02-10]
MAPAEHPQVLLRTDQPDVQAQVRRLTDLAGLDLMVVAAGRGGPPAAVVLDDDGTELHLRVDPDRTTPLPGTGPVPATVRLPRDAGALLDVLVAAGTPYRARTVGVLGAHGGAGASVLAAGLARAAVAAGAATALVDLDPAGGGLDVLLGLEHDPGQRWGDLQAERGALLPERLALALPTWQLVRVLSGDRRGGVTPTGLVVRSAVRALGQGHDVVVLDLPRELLAGGPAAELWLPWCEHLLLLTTGGVRGWAAAHAAAQALPGQDLRLVVRGAADADALAAAVGLPLAAHLREERSLPGAIEHGLTPGDQRRGPVRTTARALVASLGLVP